MALTKVNSILVDGAINTDASGNVGIGTSSPNGKLALFDTVASPVTVAIGNNSPSTSAGTRVGFYYQGVLTGYVLNQFDGSDFSNTYQAQRNHVWLGASGTERMRIDSSGNLLVGMTTTGGAGVSILPDLDTGGSINVRKGAAGSGSRFIIFDRSGVQIGAISQNGTTGVTYATTSDYRLKENVAPMTGALDKVALLKPCTYTWKADGSTGQGFIAHELQEVVPECVTGEKDAVNEDGTIKAQGIDTSFLVATLTAAIQEQQAIITDLKARIETLEAK